MHVVGQFSSISRWTFFFFFWQSRDSGTYRNSAIIVVVSPFEIIRNILCQIFLFVALEENASHHKNINDYFPCVLVYSECDPITILYVVQGAGLMENRSMTDIVQGPLNDHVS